MLTPKFLYSNATDVASPGEYIIHTWKPRCIGRIVRENEKIRVNIVECWDVMNEEESFKLCLKMKNWFYFKYERK